MLELLLEFELEFELELLLELELEFELELLLEFELEFELELLLEFELEFELELLLEFDCHLRHRRCWRRSGCCGTGFRRRRSAGRHGRRPGRRRA